MSKKIVQNRFRTVAENEPLSNYASLRYSVPRTASEPKNWFIRFRVLSLIEGRTGTEPIEPYSIPSIPKGKCLSVFPFLVGFLNSVASHLLIGSWNDKRIFRSRLGTTKRPLPYCLDTTPSSAETILNPVEHQHLSLASVTPFAGNSNQTRRVDSLPRRADGARH